MFAADDKLSVAASWVRFELGFDGEKSFRAQDRDMRKRQQIGAQSAAAFFAEKR